MNRLGYLTKVKNDLVKKRIKLMMKNQMRLRSFFMYLVLLLLWCLLVLLFGIQRHL